MIVRGGVRLTSNNVYLSNVSCIDAQRVGGDARGTDGFMSQKTWQPSFVLTFEGDVCVLVLVVGSVVFISQKTLVPSVVSAFEDDDFIFVIVFLSHAPTVLHVLSSTLPNKLLNVTGMFLIILTLGGKVFGGERLLPLFVAGTD